MMQEKFEGEKQGNKGLQEEIKGAKEAKIKAATRNQRKGAR